MNLAWPDGKQFGSPPVLAADVQVAFLGPTAKTADHGALAGAGWAGHQDLAKTDIAGESDPFEVLQ
jgi:hypothetical protein